MMSPAEIFVLYGSQTGTAEEIGERISRDALNFSLKVQFSAMDNFNIFELKTETTLCFIAATTGQGEEPDNMKKFWKSLLRRSLASNSLAHIQFSVLGLGDSSYSKYNYVAKKLFKRLSNLGAIPLTELHLADEQHELGLDAVVEPFISRFWTALLSSDQLDARLSQIYPPKFKLTPSSSSTPCHSNAEIFDKFIVMSNDRLTSHDHFQDTRLISFESVSNLNYSPGDTLLILPQNLQENISLFFTTLPQFEELKTTLFTIVPNTPFCKLPQVHSHAHQMSLVDILTKVLDLQCRPKRYFFTLLAHLAECEIEREKLVEFSSGGEGTEELFKYCYRPQRTGLEVLQDFPSASKRVTIDMLFDLFSPIKGRAFSICSSIESHGNRVVEILVARVEYKTILKKPRRGLCSNWLCRLDPSSKVIAWIERGSFNFPPHQQKVPLIMVGPGTGVAPFRSLILSRVSNSNEESNNKLLLFFGCRFKTKDFYFGEEFTELHRKGFLEFYSAFSRDKENESREYVQRKISENGEMIWKLVSEENGSIFYAGNSKIIPNCVRDAFIDIFKEHIGEEAEGFMSLLIKSNRYQTEAWS